ncbi:hypothetical protein SARC_11639 [Sphaeroforma arctica JP610]|uniref:Uncharacterized protein n=1 Tax=Sphaeroforma arctica JP610 TaxID=667725 RepID=A0A0L0FIH1_9EUKA|nr:hypothetical protein SARC_11639 [Sphaeroforma arctica JP610]KNC75843.1 hypothetical protein SARC_11639 [Sphaeroforma arctica JP610]|eukprot:XP_014149745.1 hypothetical protein SARC_11639 [Sphaeroforma arctica JP610]
MYAMSDGVKVHGSRCNSVVESQENHGANELEGDFVCGDEDDGVLPVRETVAADASGLVGTHTAVGDVGGRIDASLAAFLVTAEREYNRQLPDWVINSEIVHF